MAPNYVGTTGERHQIKGDGTRLSHQSTESAEPQDPRDTVPTVVRRVFVLVTPIDDLEDETGNERNLAKNTFSDFVSRGMDQRMENDIQRTEGIQSPNCESPTPFHQRQACPDRHDQVRAVPDSDSVALLLP